MPQEKMRKYDVVLTTYQVLEQGIVPSTYGPVVVFANTSRCSVVAHIFCRWYFPDFRKMVSPNKVRCP